jgi:hypothetical protein
VSAVVHTGWRCYRGPPETASKLSSVKPPPTVEALTEEIGRIVIERQELRAAGADAEQLEENRRRLAAAQSQLSQLLIARHLPAAGSA